jgi:hypothetical protein
MSDAPPPATTDAVNSDRGRGASAVSVAPKPKPPVPLWRWGLWSVLLAIAVVLFYGVFAIVWFSLRVVAWVAEFRARRR